MNNDFVLKFFGFVPGWKYFALKESAFLILEEQTPKFHFEMLLSNRFQLALLVGLSCISLATSAQTRKLDSLKQVLNTLSKEDERYVHTLWEAVSAATSVNKNEATNYAYNAYQLSKSNFPVLRYQAAAILAQRLSYHNLLDSTEALLDETILAMKRNDIDSLALIKCYNIKGFVAKKRNKVQEAASYYDSALVTAKNMREWVYASSALTDLGTLYFQNKAYDMALDYYQHALAFEKQYGSNPNRVSLIYSNMSSNYSGMGNLVQSEQYSDSAIWIAERNGRSRGLVILYGNQILRASTRTKNFTRAELYMKKLINVESSANDPEYQSFIAYVRSTYYLETEQFSSAWDYALKSYQLAKAHKLGEDLSNAYENIIKCSLAMKRFEDAYHYLDEWNAFKDSTNQIEEEKALLELQTRYETEKKETENQRLLQANTQQTRLNRILSGGGVLLFLLLISLFYFYRGKQKVNKKLEEQKQQIESSLREKESLLREIHHRVKNNLQVISSLLNMQSYHLQDQDMINAFAEGQSRVKAMALIHQKLYQTDQLSEIDFQEYTEQLIGHLAEAFGESSKNIHSAVNGSSLKVDIDTAIPLGLILNELITNAYKYAFTGMNEGNLKVDLKLDGEEYYHLHISDSGNGLPSDFDETRLNSLGLKLVRMLIEQLDGSLTISSEPGAHFYIRFKKSQIAA